MRIIIEVGLDETARTAKDMQKELQAVADRFAGYHGVVIRYASGYGEAGHI